MALSASQKSLRAWTRQKWRTKSGKPSTQGSEATGERYLPAAAIKAMKVAHSMPPVAKRSVKILPKANNFQAA